MRHFFALASFVFLVCTAFVCSGNSTNAQTRRAPKTSMTSNDKRTSPNDKRAPQISYTVSMPQPNSHLLEVEMTMRSSAANRPLAADTKLLMPVWTPGSYLIREYARHVQDFEVTDATNEAAQGRLLQWRKINKNTWSITTAGARAIKVNYRVYANELTVRTNELNDRHAFWNNAATLMYPENQLAAASTLTVKPPPTWKIATGLPLAEPSAQVAGGLNALQPGAPQTFRAANFDVLYDSPFLVSDFKYFEFDTRGKRHRFVLDGEGNYEIEKLQRDVPKIVEEAAKIFGGLPYDNYTFLLMAAQGGGGLEHLNSTALIARRFAFQTPAQYRGFLSLVAHEYFHLWNVKRIRPDALGPFNYTAENYTRLLWVAEGITSYYEDMLPIRAGLLTDKDYLEQLGNSIRALQNTPGRLEMSAEEASFDAWIKYYRQDENSLNSQVSYYDKGALLGLLLDLEIRRRTQSRASLDNVMQRLYNDFSLKNRNYTPEDFQKVAEQVAGGSLEDFFAKYVRGREELPFDEMLAAVGLTLKAQPEANAPAKAYFGANLTQTGETLTVRNVLAGSPAYVQGVYANDQILALNNFRVNQQSFNDRLAERKPGDEITLTVFRGDELRNLQVKLGTDPNGTYRITSVANPSDEQRRLYQSWLGAELKTEVKSDDE